MTDERPRRPRFTPTVTTRERVNDDEMVTYPPMMFWQSDLDRLRSYAIANRIGDSATALRRLLDFYEESR